MSLSSTPILPKTHAGLFVGETAVIALLLVAVAYFTRATRRRVLAALAGGLVLVAVGPFADRAASSHHLFRFTGGATSWPLLVYGQTGLAFSLVALVAWRIDRRFGVAGILALIAGFMLFLPPRDYAVAVLTHWVEFTRGSTSWLADSIGNGVAVVVPVAVMRVLGGPAKADSLARVTTSSGTVAEVR